MRGAVPQVCQALQETHVRAGGVSLSVMHVKIPLQIYNILVVNT